MAGVARTQLAVLIALTHGRTHAYDIKTRLATELGHSSVYAALARAEAHGYVTSEWEDANARPPGSGPQRKYYELTAIGRQVLLELELDQQSRAPISVARPRVRPPTADA